MRLWLAMLGLTLFAVGSTQADEAKGKPEDLFKMTKVWPIHISVSAKDWETMAPTRGGFLGFGQPGGFPGQPQPPAPPKPDEDRKPRGGFGNDYAYVKAEIIIDGKTLKDVGLRFKGNSTYMMSQNGPKRPFKVDFDHYVDHQTFNGVKKIALNNNVVDGTACRDALSYALYRGAGVPAPRTTYAAVTLTVPGKYDKEYLGLYTIVESIDKPFLKDRFGSAKGLLLKPERLGSLDYLGEDWSAYENRYQPKTDVTKKAKQRLIEFTKLVNGGNDETFKKEIGSYLDVDEFTRFLACTVLLSSMDSFIGLGHNYYLYLDPKTNKFSFMPWDFDHSFGGFPMMGTPDQLADLSIRQPNMNRNRLIERLLADDKVYDAYKVHLKKLLETTFSAREIKKDLTAINSAVAEVREKEKKAAAGRRENAFGRMMGAFGPAPDIETFVRKRSESVAAQLDGKSKGTVVAMRFGPGGGRPGGIRFGPGMFLTRPILDAADKDKDGKLSKDEAIAATKLLFKECDKEGKGELDSKALAAGIEKMLPRPFGFGPGGPGGFPGGGGPFPGGPGGQPDRPPSDRPARPQGGGGDAQRPPEGQPPRQPDGPRPGGPGAPAQPPGGGGQPPGGFPGGGQPPGGFGGGRPIFAPLQEQLAKSIVEKAGKDGRVNEARLVEAVGKIFDAADKNKDGKLDEQEIGEALREVLPPPPGFGRPGDRPFGPPGPGGDRPPGERPPSERPARPEPEKKESK